MAEKYATSQFAIPEKHSPVAGSTAALLYSSITSIKNGTYHTKSVAKLRMILFVSFSIVALLISFNVSEPPSRTTYFKSDTEGRARNAAKG